ncbi:MAG: acyl-CoA dehydrogenase family protein, partial [SAR324 cluster bacterium]|nr:acyl-CoA dehydrogenase family protein [SAR324 cluster bacterium]
MSSTEYHVNRKELQFVVMEVLEAGKLCGFEDFSEFDEDLFSMTINEACTFAEQVLDPINQSGDREGCQVENGSVKTPQGFPEAWRKMGEGGWLAMNMPPDFGGMGLPELVTVAAKEVQLAANQSLCIGNTLTTGAANLIVNFGSDEQKEEYCENMFNGTWSGTMCLTEPHAGSAVGDIITTAAQQPEGHYLIKGTKQFITTGDHDMSENIIHLLLARTEGAPDGTKGISLFIVPKFRKDGTQNDVTLVNIEKKMGLHASPTCVLSFGEKGDCHGYLLQAENKGMAQMFQMMNEA